MPLLPLFADAELVTPAPGLMIWTLLIFFLSFLVLRKKVFGPIANAIEERRAAVRENIESAERSRDEAHVPSKRWRPLRPSWDRPRARARSCQAARRQPRCSRR